MTELELLLHHVRAEVEWPATPDLAARFAERNEIHRMGGKRSSGWAGISRRWRIGRPLAVALALLVLATAAAYAAIPGLRDAVQDFLGTDSVEIERVPALPSAPSRADTDLGLGAPTSLRAARTRLDFAPRVPAFRPTERVHATGRQIHFVYGRGDDRILVSEFRGDVPAVLLRKLVDQGVRIERLRIAGDPAVWLSGRPHLFLYRDPAGEIRDEDVRLAGNTLIWSHDGLVVRIEGADNRADALRIARSLP